MIDANKFISSESIKALLGATKYSSFFHEHRELLLQLASQIQVEEQDAYYQQHPEETK